MQAESITMNWRWRRKPHYSFQSIILFAIIVLSSNIIFSKAFQVAFIPHSTSTSTSSIRSTAFIQSNHNFGFYQDYYYPSKTKSFLSSTIQSIESLPTTKTRATVNNYCYINNHNNFLHNTKNFKNRRKTCLYMGKGDGKKKRKKASASGSNNNNSSAATPPTPQPLRVTNDSLVPVRRQIRWAQMKKEAERNSGTSFRQTNVKRTKYRKSLDEEEIEQARIERQKKGQDVDWDVILNATASTPLVIVDGYNIIHKYPRFKKWMKKGMLSKARNMLIHDMEELRALKGWRIEVVFDGYGKDVNGPLGDSAGSQMTREKVTKSDQEASKKVTNNGVRVVFSGAGMSADGYIEGRCYDAKKVTDGKLTGSLIIATDDNLIRSAGVSAGAVSMSADRLIDELKALRRATMYRVEAAVAKANGHAIRPPQLMGKTMPSALTKGSIIIEDKRNRPKKKKKEEGEQTRTLEDLKKGTTTLPSWAVVPPKDNFNQK